MKSLRSRILVTLSLLAILLVVVTVLSSRAAFQRGFLDYLNQQMRQRMEVISLVVGTYYDERNGFDRLRREPGLWISLLGDRGRDFFSNRGSGMPPPGRVLEPADIELALVDAEGRWVAGRRFDQLPDEALALQVPVLSRGETVGYIVAPRMPRFEAQLDRNFVHQQQRSILTIGLLALLITLPIGWLITSRVLSPVKQLTQGVRSLTEGDYAVRLSLQRQDELGQLADMFNQLSRTLDANRSAQQRWIADISHELRTPVAILEAELEAIQDGVRQADDSQLASLLDDVRRLGGLINDLYELSRSDSGDLSYQMESLNLVELLDRVCQAFSSRARQAGLDLQAHLEYRQVMVLADEARLYQLFANLLENSCRYTDAGGQVRVSLTAADGRAQVLVQDSAPGVPEQQLPLLFDRLYRVESSRSRETGGAGLGLSICQNIARAHGATLEVSASELGGLAFRFELPINEDSQ